ncbi:MAG TPA: hypothetical protein VK437_00550 [Steroidobacteraceae bacterium]|nr:hypothetical protein [Steroidobacteraceae bacterium]
MQIESIALVLRPRSMWEGCDLGVRLLQSWLRTVFSCYLAVAVPLFALLFATYAIASWLPALLIWLAKPWLDRTVLFSLSRALFGEPTTPLDVWAARRQVWWSKIVVTLTLQRLSASRSFKQPILQLEGLSGADLRSRVRQLTLKHRGVARTMTLAFANAEIALFSSILALQAWLAPHAFNFQWSAFAEPFGSKENLLSSLAYAAVVAFLEPFYVAAGFGLYLNRRVELEAWDLEQEFRRVFAT